MFLLHGWPFTWLLGQNRRRTATKHQQWRHDVAQWRQFEIDASWKPGFCCATEQGSWWMPPGLLLPGWLLATFSFWYSIKIIWWLWGEAAAELESHILHLGFGGLPQLQGCMWHVDGKAQVHQCCWTGRPSGHIPCGCNAWVCMHMVLNRKRRVAKNKCQGTSGQCSHGDSGARPWWPVYLSENPWLSWLEAVCQQLKNFGWFWWLTICAEPFQNFLEPDGQLSKNSFWHYALALGLPSLDQVLHGLSPASSVMVTNTWLFNLYRSVPVSTLTSPSVALWLQVTI